MSKLDLKTEGFNRDDVVRVDTSVCSSGKIRDGIAFAHGINGRDGYWVISFADLERIYESAKKERANK